MQDFNELSINVKLILAEANENKFRAPYHKPILDELGDLRALTLGGSPGCLDSGNPISNTDPLGGGLPC